MDESINYNELFCHACLCSNRTLCSVGDYLDIYLYYSRIKNLTSQVNVCWECMALLKKVHAFKKKVEKAQKILDQCVQKQIPLEGNLSDLTLSRTKSSEYYQILEHEDADEYEHYIEISGESKMTEDLSQMFRIENVRGRCDIMDVMPVLDQSELDITSQRLLGVHGSAEEGPCLQEESGEGSKDTGPVCPEATNSCDMTANTEPASPEDDEERRYRQWKAAALLVYKRICSHGYAHHFVKPVSDELAPLYSSIVRRPTDLSKIKRWIKNGVVRTTADLTCLLLLMFSNALMYNSCYHKIYQMTLEFREETIRELSLLQEVLSQTDHLHAPQRRHSARECSASRRRSVRECSAPRRRSVRECSPPRRRSVRECSASRRRSVRECSPPRRRSVRECSAPRRRSVRECSAPRRRSVRECSPPRRRPVRECSAPRRRSVRECSPPRRRSVRECSPPRRRSVRECSPPRRRSVRECSTPRRPSVRDCTTSVPPASSAGVSPAARVPQPLTRRRKSLWDASQEARKCPTPVPPASLAGAASPPLALPSRRSAPASVLKPLQPLARRRKSEWDASQEDLIKTAVAPRSRRKSVYEAEPAEPPAKRRAKYDWPCLDNEYLVASCFKKSTVLL